MAKFDMPAGFQLNAAARSATHHALAVLRLKPCDGATVEGRSRERLRRIALASLGSAAARGVFLLTLILSVPLTLGYLGPERYGLWMAISSFVGLMGFADLGLGNGLLSALAEANGQHDREAARRYISSALVILSAAAAIFLCLFALLYAIVPWQRVFNVSSPLAVAEAGPALAAFMVCLLVNLPLGVIHKTQLGYQDGLVNSLWEMAGSVLGLVGLLVAIHLQLGLPWLVWASCGAPLLASVANGLILFGWQRPWLRPHWSYVSAGPARGLFRLGLLFLLLQVVVAVAYWSDNLIITHVLGPAAVAQYAVPARLFSIPSMLLGFVLAPLWPAYGEAIACGDHAWVRRTFVKSLAWTLAVSGTGALILVSVGTPLIDAWAGPVVRPSNWLLVGLGVWLVLGACGNALGTFLNAAHVVRFQAIVAPLMAAAKLLLSIFLAREFGLPGIVWGTVIAYGLVSLIPTAIVIPRSFAGLLGPTTTCTAVAKVAA